MPATRRRSRLSPRAPRRLTGAISHAEVRTIFFGLMLTALLAALNQTIIATALPTIGRRFADFESLSWVVTAYLLTSTAVAPLYGKLSDIHGRRAMLLTAVGLFIAGSVLCAAAPDMLLLILGRGLQGIGGGGILPLCQSVIADVVAPRERGRYQAYMGVVWVTSGVLGPVLGGVLAEYWDWSVIFWLNVPLGLAAALLIHVHLAHIPRHERKHKLDVLGAVLMMGSAIPLLLALTWGGTQYSWVSPEIFALLAASFRAVARLRLAADARERAVPAAHRAAQPGDALGRHLRLVRDGRLDRAHHPAAALFRGRARALRHPIRPRADPGSRSPRPARCSSGRAMLYWKHYKRAPVIGLVCALLALAVLIWRPDLPLVYVIVIMAVVGTAIGLVYPVTTVSIQNAVPLLSGRHRHGRAQLLPLARERLRGGGDGRDPAGRPRRDAAARRRRVGGDVDDERERRRRRASCSAGCSRRPGSSSRSRWSRCLLMEERPLRSTPAGSEPPG